MHKAKLIAVSALAAAIVACGQSRAQVSDASTQRQFAVTAFRSIEVAGPYDVQVRTGGAPSVSASGPQALIERMIVEVDGDRLVIRPRRENGFNWRSSDGVVRVQVIGPMLHGASIAGSGEINVDRIKGQKFNGSIAGSGDLRVQSIDVDALKLAIAGSGNFTASQGQARGAEYEIAGSGDIETGAIRVGNASISIAGAGSVNSQATETADISIMGSGDVRLTGGARCTISKMGSGDVVCS